MLLKFALLFNSILLSDLITERALEHLSLELSAKNFASLILGQRVDEHAARSQVLVGSSSFFHPVDNVFFQNLAILANHVSTRELSGSIIGDSDDSNVIHTGMSANQILKLRWCHLNE